MLGVIVIAGELRRLGVDVGRHEQVDRHGGVCT